MREGDIISPSVTVESVRPIQVGVGLTRRDKMCNRKFVSENADHSKCQWSTGIHDCLTVGQGELDMHGFWEHGCPICARRHEVDCGSFYG